MTPLLDAALGYAARGWPVFPCWPGRKNPATDHGFKDATTDSAQIRAWWTARPDCNVAIATGAQSVDVLDIDIEPGADGFGVLAELTTAGLMDGHGPIVKTRSGGLHYYFTGTPQGSSNAREKAPADFKATGGYVLAPPSWVEADDKPAGHYEFLSEEPGTGATLDWRMVKDLLIPPPAFAQPERPERQAPAEGRVGDDFAARSTWPDILTEHGWQQLRHAGSGVRYWRRPGKTKGGMSASTRDNGGLWVFSSSTDFKQDTLYTKLGAWTLLHGYGEDYSAAVAELRRLGYGPPPAGQLGQPPPFQQPTPVPAAAATSDQAPTTEPPAAAQLPGALPDYDLGALAAQGIPEPKRIAGGMLYPSAVHCIAGTPGGGKTTIAAWWMLTHIRDGGNVMLLDEESGPEQAAEKFLDLGATPDELSPPRLTYVPFPARGWNTADLGHLHALITERKPGIVTWDSAAAFLAIAGQDENSATDVTAFWQKVLVPVARQHGAAVVAIDHTVKTGDAAGFGRGSGAKKAASDVQYMLDTIRPFNRSQNGLLRLTTAPGKDRRGWLEGAYEILVKTGDTITLDITAATIQARNGGATMRPAKQKIWEALNAIATDAKPATGKQLVDWIAARHGHGLERPTVSKALNELAADGLANYLPARPGADKTWYPITTPGDNPWSGASSSDGYAVHDTFRQPSGRAARNRSSGPVSSSGYASPVTRNPASAPPKGADDDDDTPTRHDQNASHCGTCGELLPHEGRPCQDPGAAA